MEKPASLNDHFSVLKRASSFKHAGRGVYVFVRNTHNAWVHLVVLAIAVALGMWLHISVVEWMVLVLAGGVVLVAEALNTAIEIAVDLVSPEYHPLARDIKDVAAGAVLIASVTALINGFFIFGHYFIDLL